MAVLEMKGICYAYEKGRPILSDINTEFEVGKMYAVLGPSGSGKTTMLSLIGGLDIPQKGEILFSGENISQCGLACHRRSHVSLIFQSYNLIDYMTPMENVALTAKKDCPFKMILCCLIDCYVAIYCALTFYTIFLTFFFLIP